MLQTFAQNHWTNRKVVNYSSLVSNTSTVILNLQVVENRGDGNYIMNSGTPVQLTGMTGTVVSGSGTGASSIVSAYTPPSTKINFYPDFSVSLDMTSVIQFVWYYSFFDVPLFGIPANHVITGVQINTISSFVLNNLPGYSLWVYVGNSNILTTPTNDNDGLISDVTKTYGMCNVTIPAGSGDAYEYGSFYWFSFSGPGGPTYSRNSMYGTLGSYCLPQRLDAHDVIARFCILSDAGTPAAPVQTGYPLSTLMAGDVEIAVQYTAI
jgi:hypothetical protein